jgi:hypothetical protein
MIPAGTATHRPGRRLRLGHTEGVPRAQDVAVTQLVDKARGRSGFVPLRCAFLQLPPGKPGPMASFVRRHDGRALDMLLMIHAVTSSQPWDVRLEAGAWARLLFADADENRRRTAAVSKVIARLKSRSLVTTRRSGSRMSRITKLCEDGSAEAYTLPYGANRFCSIPIAFWTSPHAYYRTMPLSAKAVLLIALCRGPNFQLPVEAANKWYGISQETLTGGLQWLLEKRVLQKTEYTERSYLTALPYLIVRRYQLIGDFARRERVARSSIPAGTATHRPGRRLRLGHTEGVPRAQDVAVTQLVDKARGRSGFVPLRCAFLQLPPGKPGPMASFVRRHDGRALDMLLMIHAVTSSQPWDVRLEAGAWARLLFADADENRRRTAAVSKVIARLKSRSLVTTRRSGSRMSRITKLCEDGSAEAYTLPYGANRFCSIPIAFWTSPHAYYRTMPLSAKAVLLIALCRGPNFQLPVEAANKWYGISQETLTGGLQWLLEKRVLQKTEYTERSYLTALPYLIVRRYQLIGDFARRERVARSSGD